MGVTVHTYVSTDMFTNCLKAIWNKYDMTNVKTILYTQGLSLDVNKLSFRDKETTPDQQLVTILDDVPPPTMIEIREDDLSDKHYKEYEEERKTTPLIILSMIVGIPNANGIKYSIDLYHTENRRTTLDICCSCKELRKMSHIPNDDVNVFGSSKCVYDTCEKKGCPGKLITNMDLYLEHEQRLNAKSEETA